MLVVNSVRWRIVFVPPDSPMLTTDNGIQTLGMTDNRYKAVFLSDRLSGEKLYDVLCHELVHVYCFSYGIAMDGEDEEHMAQFISEYGRMVVSDTDALLRNMGL